MFSRKFHWSYINSRKLNRWTVESNSNCNSNYYSDRDCNSNYYTYSYSNCNSNYSTTNSSNYNCYHTTNGNSSVPTNLPPISSRVQVLRLV